MLNTLDHYKAEDTGRAAQLPSLKVRCTFVAPDLMRPFSSLLTVTWVVLSVANVLTIALVDPVADVRWSLTVGVTIVGCVCAYKRPYHCVSQTLL